MLYAVASEVGEELDGALKDQDRLQDSKEFTNCCALHNAARADVNNTSAKLSGAFKEVSNRPATHEATCVDVKKANQRTIEVKRKATEAREKLSSHRERSRRITNEHTRSETAANNSLGFLGR